MLKKKTGPITSHAGTVSVLPHELRVGDRFTDQDGVEWAVITQPTLTWLGGRRHCAHVERVGDPAATRQVVWQSNRLVVVRRSAA
jgi:hypothetical protein